MSGSGSAVSTWEGAHVDEWRTRWGVPHLDIYARVRSTNDAARALAEAGAAAGTIVLADEQTAGRGRMGRTWTAPPGKALLMSVILRPGERVQGESRPGTAPIRVALAVARALERAESISAGVKWPNDIVVPGAGKLAGILCEASLALPGPEYVVAGIGINTGQSAADFPEELRDDATSVLIVSGHVADRPGLAAAVIAELQPFDGRALRPLDTDELAEFDARDVLRGRAVQIDGAAAGTAAGIATDAALLISTADGTVPVHFGTVRFRDSGNAPGHAEGRRRENRTDSTPEGTP